MLKNVYISYTTKMWGMKFNNVDHDIINRVKIILGYQHNYFPLDKYQGLPIGGYTSLIKKMISHKNITIKYKTNANRILKFNNKNILLNDHEIKFPIIYCGSLDELLKYKYGILGYRSLNIHFKTLPINKFQSTAVINYPNHPKITRIVIMAIIWDVVFTFPAILAGIIIFLEAAIDLKPVIINSLAIIQITIQAGIFKV